MVYFCKAQILKRHEFHFFYGVIYADFFIHNSLHYFLNFLLIHVEREREFYSRTFIIRLRFPLLKFEISISLNPISLNFFCIKPKLSFIIDLSFSLTSILAIFPKYLTLISLTPKFFKKSSAC